MADNKTDAEIKKALECCCNSQGCSKCDFSPKCDGFTSVKLALQLINRQEEEIEQLRKVIVDGEFTSITALRAKESWSRQNAEYIDRLNEEIESLKAENVSLKEKNSNLTSDLTSLQKDLTSSKAEVERLKNNISAMATTLSNSAKATRHEAYKEFAERLIRNYSVNFSRKDCFMWAVDNLLNELVGKDHD